MNGIAMWLPQRMIATKDTKAMIATKDTKPNGCVYGHVFL